MKTKFLILFCSATVMSLLTATPYTMTLHAGDIVHSLKAEFDSKQNPSPSGWTYHTARPPNTRLAGPATESLEASDFGAGLIGWEGFPGSSAAGWAIVSKANKNANGWRYQVGDIIAHGPSAVSYTIRPDDGNGTLDLSGGVWIIRPLKREQGWTLYKNKIVISTANEMVTFDNSSPAKPYPFNKGSGGDRAVTNVPYQPGDVFMLAVDFHGGRLYDYFNVDFVLTLHPKAKAKPEPDSKVILGFRSSVKNR